jgi:hypothetical protein
MSTQQYSVRCTTRRRWFFFALLPLLLCATGHADEQKLEPSTPGLFFGEGLAVSDGSLFVGSTQGFSPVSTNGSSGYVDIYVRQPSGWSYTSTLTAFDLGPLLPNGSDAFGNAIAVEGDWLAIAGQVSFSNINSVYIFHRVNSAWTQFQRIDKAFANNSTFGEALALHLGHLLVGAMDFDTEGDPQNGHVFAYELAGDTFVPLGELGRPLSALGDNFGQSLAFVGDRLVTSAPYFTDETGKRGLVFTYVFNFGQWASLSLLQPDNSSALSFGYKLASCLGGQQLAVAAPNVFGSAGVQVGYIETFQPSETGWQVAVAQIQPTDSSVPASYASAIACDGSVLAAVAPGSNLGYQFIYLQNTWQQSASYSSADPSNDRFSGPIAVASRDVVISDTFQGTPTRLGAVYAFNSDVIFANGFE